MEEQEEEQDRLILQDQKVFGTGLKRKRVQFVPAAALEDEPATVPKPSARNAGDRYLSIVLPNEGQKVGKAGKISHDPAQAASKSGTTEEDTMCEICHLPVNSIADSSLPAQRPHETSLVHQVCLAQSHPPSHLDRSRVGLKYLSSYGWDPDSRLGLGVRGEGIRVPIKPKIKNDTVGLGVRAAQQKGLLVEKKKIERLDEKGVRKKEAGQRKKREKLQEMFYRNEDLERYLGSNA